MLEALFNAYCVSLLHIQYWMKKAIIAMLESESLALVEEELNDEEDRMITMREDAAAILQYLEDIHIYNVSKAAGLYRHLEAKPWPRWRKGIPWCLLERPVPLPLSKEGII